MSAFNASTLAFALLLAQLALTAPSVRVEKQGLRVGVASIAITPFGPNPDWDGSITALGVWGEKFNDTNRNGRWDAGEPFEDDPGNDALDPSSRGKYDGIYLAGFGNNRIATGKHDDLESRAIIQTDGVVPNLSTIEPASAFCNSDTSIDLTRNPRRSSSAFVLGKCFPSESSSRKLTSSGRSLAELLRSPP